MREPAKRILKNHKTYLCTICIPNSFIVVYHNTVHIIYIECTMLEINGVKDHFQERVDLYLDLNPYIDIRSQIRILRIFSNVLTFLKCNVIF